MSGKKEGRCRRSKRTSNHRESPPVVASRESIPLSRKKETVGGGEIRQQRVRQKKRKDLYRDDKRVSLKKYAVRAQRKESRGRGYRLGRGRPTLSGKKEKRSSPTQDSREGRRGPSSCLGKDKARSSLEKRSEKPVAGWEDRGGFTPPSPLSLQRRLREEETPRPPKSQKPIPRKRKKIRSSNPSFHKGDPIPCEDSPARRTGGKTILVWQKEMFPTLGCQTAL